MSDDIDERWREGWWGLHFPGRVPMHVKEALHFGWSSYFSLFPVRLVTGALSWLKRIERRQVHAPGWFMNGNISWQEYRAAPQPKEPSE